MATLLYIKANPKTNQDSRTFRISETFIDSYRKKNPGDQIIIRDLYEENVQPLTAEQLQERFNAMDEESIKKHPVYKYALEFKNADKIVIAAPMWNLGFPAILKCYLDYIMAVGITFKYTENGPVGLCEGGKKVVHIVTRGGVYSEGPAAAYEMGDKYLRVVFGFLGIYDFTTIAAEMLDVIGTDVEGIMANALKDAEDTANNF
ncbi:acyl carrier protein phosphodiesterase [Desulfosporosinus orientis DSM 765]|uniref:FMN dependent NADH:quinone oxidoreductase n=1 Tax=Desulfosporosinus orientis (strain ATCC 19365 / DSM 765 / NCIMB 8382 / VKM B-1628 / Singapore I) TaxID=768706 RepID=G7W6E9_DESOD|nr:NAD(P)H-dependent oxidoreductase [Desulfosporosinus orientis]AET68156.1 acyl carrier protein phosphodiesterase [Desulfosporosinus orientis DSM 765]